jgi:hypothetical protein
VRPLLAALLFAGSAFAPALAADRVVFENGNELTGVVESQSDSEVMLRIGDRVVRIARSRVREVLVEPRDAPAAPAAQAQKSAGPAPTAKQSPADGPAAGASAEPSPAAAPAPPRPEATGEGAPAAGGAAGEAVPPAPPLPPDPVLLAKFVKGTPMDRAEAAAQIRAGWPATRPTIEVLLANPDAVVRVGAASILLQPELVDTAVHAPGLLVDSSALVRCIGVRVARRGKAAGVEPTLIAALANDPDAAVKYEALRALEDIGTPACLTEVAAQFEREKDVRKRRRYLRVLRRLTGENHGDDAFEAWHAAAERAQRRAANPALAAAEAAAAAAAAAPAKQAPEAPRKTVPAAPRPEDTGELAPE